MPVETIEILEERVELIGGYHEVSIERPEMVETHGNGLRPMRCRYVFRADPDNNRWVLYRQLRIGRDVYPNTYSTGNGFVLDAFPSIPTVPMTSLMIEPRKIWPSQGKASWAERVLQGPIPCFENDVEWFEGDWDFLITYHITRHHEWGDAHLSLSMTGCNLHVATLPCRNGLLPALYEPRASKRLYVGI